MENILKTRNDTLYVVNFWATWCKPCVAELPVFIQAEDTFSNQKVRFIYVSLDFKRDYQTRLLPFAEKQLAGRTVYLLDAPDYNAWINKVSPSWQGAIPATLMFRGNPQYNFFLEGEFHNTELTEKLKPLLHYE
jgi:thiol-disulfide isomerase/thioredoxin